MNKGILVINPGATSTKIAYFEKEDYLAEKVVQHDATYLQNFPKIIDQLAFRLKEVLTFVENQKIHLSSLAGIVARGGLLPPLHAGGYEVNLAMIDYLTNRPRVDHASNLGALIGYELSKQTDFQVKAYIYDPVTVDEFSDVARVSGLKGIERESIGHTLNMKAVARLIAKENHVAYAEKNYIVAHLGGGNSVSLHQRGKMIDLISDDEGPFSTERTGALPVKNVIDWCYRYSQKEMTSFYRKIGGFYSYMGTNDIREIETKKNQGEPEALLLLEAFVYQVCKAIGSLATVTAGEIDGIILTGGVAHSEWLMAQIVKQVSFLAKVDIVPGEKEMEALAAGMNRIIDGEEIAQIYSEEE